MLSALLEQASRTFLLPHGYICTTSDQICRVVNTRVMMPVIIGVSERC